ncbi:hypothetical protein OFO10_05945 [Campylobacter sp. VBCF_06 NA8]|uniref:hypothetical protein n=1 Tax=Campylobacter sp. VBCF_06 NA8 TaxID=2983822 RepID=UPI0022E9D1B3|nr:hypothetical protein [Campylobacter sp. VBCF_06 NA8]MDA3046696.1 hypothetical protein [Campylobacter sp. VBCF_06 NA8]
MRFEKTILNTRSELLEKIQAFLGACGWECYKKDSQTLYAKNHTGGGIIFHFIPFVAGYGVYHYVERSTIHVSDSIDENLAYNAQPRSAEVSYFEFQQDSNKELGEVTLIGDSENFTLALNCKDFPEVYHYSEKDPPVSYPFMLVFSYSLLAKSHEFNGGSVAYSSIWRINYSGYYPQQTEYNSVPFTKNTKTLMSLGGAWRDLYNADLRNSLILTNLIPANTNTNSADFNALSPLSAKALLEVQKSSLSGLFTLIKPLFYYKNNAGKFVYAGSVENIRVIKEQNQYGTPLTNGQILNLGDAKFMLIQPFRQPKTNYSYSYWLAVRVA